MIKATYDTNVLASGSVSPQGQTTAFVIDAWVNDDLELITSEPLIIELSRTLEKSYFTSRLTRKQIQSFIYLVRERAIIVQITAQIPKVATHPEDDMVLATAESGKAKYIVTGDYGLQDMKQYKNIQIVSPQAFRIILLSKTL
ncbi:putative toxin-antitoxin system toxin component, PIN family [Candidatus Roizmanbacteria bacterium]|nr:putative toxin-antitoxin system toxin component, PIN family [Candidatus Roizmanbacteria bacterium]